jgi:thioredoxin-related protein
MKKTIVSILLLSCLINVLHAQTPGLSGVWVLKERKSISGPDYANGIPKQMTLVLSPDSLSLLRTYDGGEQPDYTINESLALNGSATEVLRTTSKRKSILKKGNDANSFSIEVTYRDINTGKPTSADFTEKWNMAASGKELTIEKQATGSDGNTWGITGLYQLKTSEELAAEAATGKGIQFTNSESWSEIKALAKREHKYIFVDCYATWCVPCKQMEKDIFPLNKVGEAMNESFIAVRLQMDTTKKDNENVKAWYATAHDFVTNYTITGYPSFLFFDADGNIVHKSLGYFKADEFINLLKEARDPNKQYYSLLHKFRTGEKNNETLYDLISAAKKLNDKKTAEEVVKLYKSSFLDKLPADSLLNEKYLKLAMDFQELLIPEGGSKGAWFKLFYKKGKEADAILNMPGFSSFQVNGIITKEEIENKVYSKGKPVANPQWDKILSAIRSKYPILNAEKLLLDGQIGYFYVKKDWNNLVKFFVKKVEHYGPLAVGRADGSSSDNVIGSILLPHCDDKVILNKAIGWMETIINSKAYLYPVPMVYGNYGAILYKAGKRKEGIAALEKQLDAMGYKTTADIDKADPFFKEKWNYLQRMKRGEKIDATWKPYIFN